MTTSLYSLVFVLTALSPATSSGDLVPGRAANDAVSQLNVEGTMWKGETWFDTGRREIFIVRFERGGTLIWTTETGTFDDGKWTQNGRAILIELNNKYSTYRGTIHGDHIRGDARNVIDAQWKWDVKRAGLIRKNEMENLPMR